MGAAAATTTWTPELFESQLSPLLEDPPSRSPAEGRASLDLDMDLPDVLRLMPSEVEVPAELTEDWAHAMAHDLNNCITALRLTFDLITEVRVSPQQLDELVSDGQEVLDRAAALVANLHEKGE